MNIETLKDRISKKEIQIEKINRRIAKWAKQCSQEEINIADEFRTKTYGEFNRFCKANNVGGSFTPLDELRRAYIDLDEADAQLEKYNQMLAGEEQKANTEKIPAIVDFLNEWKEHAAEYVRNNVPVLEQYYIKDHEETEWINNKQIEHPREVYNQMKREIKELWAQVHPWTYECTYHETVMGRDKYGFEGPIRTGKILINEQKLQEILDKEAEAKYWELVKRIEDLAGNIVNAYGLEIGPKGNLEGLVQGDRELVRVETIVAGGWNTGRIVNVRRGPIAHYRTLVNIVRR